MSLSNSRICLNAEIPHLWSLNTGGWRCSEPGTAWWCWGIEWSRSAQGCGYPDGQTEVCFSNLPSD